MVGAALDWLFDMLCEHALLGVGARVLTVLQFGRRPLHRQMEHAVPNLLAGLALWTAVVVTLVSLL